MASETLSAQTKIAADVMARARRSAMRRLHQSSLFKWRYNGTPIEQLVLFPQDLRTADPSFASEIYHGNFGLAGAAGRTGSESPFSIFPPSPEWEIELHGFGWLHHLRAAGDKISREHARALVRDWIALNRVIGGLPWRPEIVARRIISWLSHLSIVLDGGDQAFYDDVMGSLSRQVRYMRTTFRDMPASTTRLQALIALMLSGLCTDEQSIDVGACAKLFAREAAGQVLPDGGHVTRNPAVLVELLHDLLPLRQCFIARDQPPPEALSALIDRMMSMLRFFRMGDGSLARFNGAGATPIYEIVNVLAYDDAMGAPVMDAAFSGYCRLSQGNSIVIADVGGPPPLALSQEANAGCLSFEMSSGPHPMIVNCGAHKHTKKEWRLVTRTTPAHSTLSVANTSSSQFLSFPLLDEPMSQSRLMGPDTVETSSRSRAGILDVQAAHDGYMSRFGLIHQRSLRLMNDGTRLEGVDRLTAPEGLTEAARAADGEYALRFHLHPAVRAELARDAMSALLVLPNREGWRLVIRQGHLRVKESVFLATMGGRNHAQQLVLEGSLYGDAEIRLNWSIEQSAPAGRGNRAKARSIASARSNELPFAES